ncbi:tubulin-like doman-containing protein [Myxosarcina sp. GI1]|uniref:tubulin-like doman-containing protein n=1 Tax=Myxosarcina sp. GI1 TaxID=1541065 RepID=UPI00056122CF|nr:tubulin-like doman-containing protein [Myxosarcina sp. GI1]
MKFEEKQSRKINRTVCIGLGGTGRDVLMRIRRLIVDRHVDLKQLPVISFVHIDTDKATSNMTGLRTGNTYHGVDLRFSDAEKVAATMTRSEVDNLARELSRRGSNYDGTPGVFSNISSWFPPQLLKNLKAIDEGAQAIRPVGRLAFFHNYRKIKAAIETAEQRTRGHEAFMIRNNWSVENKLSIYVIGSLCGGTGSGVFLDVAYCLRQLYGIDGAQIIGYLVISPELYGNAPDKNANTYAALKELNYYATAGTTFKAEYDTQNLEFVEESRPPFEYVYLVSNRTAKDYKIIEKSKLCNIIAHKVTLDFAGELSPVITAQRDNFLQHMIQTDEHPRPNVQRYLTFGLAEIYFPRDIAVQISLNRIKIKLVDFWLQGEGQSADPSNLLASFLDRWYNRGKNENGFVSKLQQATTDGSKTFNNALSSWKNRLENNIIEIQNRDERQEVISQLGREIRSEFRKVQPGETESSRGIWFTSLQQQRDRLTAEYIKDIDNYLTELLNPNSFNFSLNNTRAWLEALTTELNKSFRELEDSSNSMGQIHSLEAVERKWQDAQQTIEDIESKKGLFPRDKQKNSQVQDEAKRIISQVSKLLKDNYELSLYREALTIVKALQHYVSELITKVSAFNNLLNSVRLAYEKTESELKLQDVDDMSGEAIFADADSDDCYKNLLPERDRASQLALVSSKITEKVGLKESLASCLDRGVIDEQNLQLEINLVVDGLFGSRSLSTVQSAVKRFLESYPLSDRAVRLEQIIREAEPLLPLNTSDPYFYNDSGKTLSIIAFKDTDKPEITQFKNILFNDLGVSDNNLKPIQAEDEIILVNEYGAFPLRLIRGIELMQGHYQRQKTYGKGFLHNDYRTQFIDIIPPDAIEIENLQDIFYPAIALDLLPYNDKTKEYEFQYYDSYRDSHETIFLSYIWDEALEQLASRKDMVEALDKRLRNAIVDLSLNPQKWNSYYLPKLRHFITTVDSLPEDDPNYLYKEIVVGSPATIDRRQQDGIINRFWKKMQDIVKEEMAKQKQSQQQQTLPPESTGDPRQEAVFANRVLPESNNFESNGEKEPIEGEIELIEPTRSNNTSKAKLAELKELIQMKNEGDLSEAEFSAAKRNLLGM